MAADAKDENTLDSTWNRISLHGFNDESTYISETNFAHTSNKDFMKSVNIYFSLFSFDMLTQILSVSLAR
jgi:hypothetical protein